MLIESASERGYPHNPDYNGADQEGFGYFQTTMRNGRRLSAARAFLHPVMSRPNLTVLTNTQATNITFEGNRATGVQVVRNGQKETLRAERETILSAGAIQSPQLLELSGIGQADRLKDLGIDVKHDSPGVGENLHDHYIVRLSWELKNVRTLNERLRGVSLVGEVLKYAFGRTGGLSTPAGAAYGFVRTRPELETPDVQYHIVHASFRDPKKRVFDKFPGLTMGPCQLRPQSRGTLHIRSADPLAAPIIAPNILHEPEDRATLIAGMRVAREVVSSGPLAKHVVREVAPGPEFDSDEKMLEYGRNTGATVYHPVGTCKMGRDPMAVVDDQLRVHGIEGLRIIDASVMPQLTSGNTNAPTIMIAEKGADLIKAANA
jgi:choline dehydrogenase